MRVFTHGSNVNFQTSAREMYASDLHRLLQRRLQESTSLLLGTLDLNRQELKIYGTLVQAEISEEKNQCSFTFSLMNQEGEQTIEHSYEELLISHEARFDIIDDQKGNVEYGVLYISFLNEQTGEETTYFFADEKEVSNPLACVVQFWEKVHEVGRDIDFNLTGCIAHKVDFLRKNQ